MLGPNESTKTYDVAAIGCGLLGAAMARAFASNGLRVAAWNRSPERALAIEVDGITAVTDVDEAVRSARLVIACTSTYDTTRSALEQVTDWEGVTLVNLGSGAPDDVDAMNGWADERGVPYLDGTVLSYPDDVGTQAGFVMLSGSAEGWAEHERALSSLGGGVRYVSARARTAAALETAIIGLFYIPAFAAYVETVAYAQSEEIPAELLRHVTLHLLDELTHTTDQIAKAIANDDHSTDQATLDVFADGARTNLRVLEAAGQQAHLLTAASGRLDAAQAAGLGDLGFSALARLAGPRDAPA